MILAGIPEDLRQQTQERIDKYIFRRELNISGNDYKFFDEESVASKSLNLNPLTYASDKEEVLVAKENLNVKYTKQGM